MSALDWSEAPEGATHYYVGSESPWRDLSGQDWKHWHEGAWHGCPPELARGLDLSSQGLIDRSGEYLIPRPSPANRAGLPSQSKK